MSELPITPYALAREEGARIPGSQTLVKAGIATGAPFTLLEAHWPAGGGPPPHVHADEDELFYLLDGRLTVRCGRTTWQLEPGGLAFCPRGILHQPSTDARQGAHVLVLTSRPGIERFLAVVAQQLNRLPPEPVSLEFLDQVGEPYGYTHFPPEAFDALR